MTVTIPPPALYPREQEAIQLLAEGLERDEIAARMFVSPSTAKTHISRAYAKLGAPNAVTAVLNAIRAGLITVDGITATPDTQARPA